MPGLPRWARVKAGVCDRGLSTDRVHKRLRDGPEEPPHCRVGTAALGDGGGEGCQGLRDGARRAGEQLLCTQDYRATQTRLLKVLLARSPADSAHIVLSYSRAWPADPISRFGAADEDFDVIAEWACTWVAQHSLVTADADWPERPTRGVNGLRAMTYSALGLAGSIATGAEVCAAVLASSRHPALFPATSARPDGCLVAALAE